MTKSKNTKRALLMSVLSMILCIAMLAGSTFAWFTDTVTSGTNRIVAGNLDVELYYKNAFTEKGVEEDAKKWANASEASVANPNFFVDNEGKDILWEPGVMAVTQFKVANVGTLALEYSLETLKADCNTFDDHDLSEVIKFAVIDNGNYEAGKTTREQILSLDPKPDFKDFTGFTAVGHLLPKDKEPYEKIFTVVAYWEPNVKDDNLYNVNNGATLERKDKEGEDRLYIDIEIKLVATQYTYEEDSFGNDYDADASAHTVKATPETAQKILDEVDDNTIVRLAPGDYAMLNIRPSYAHYELVDGKSNYYKRNINNLTIVGGDGVNVDGITINAGHVYGKGAYNPVTQTTRETEGSSHYQYLDLKNITIEGLKLTKAISIGADQADMFWMDGLTIRNCSYQGTDRAVNVEGNKLFNMRAGIDGDHKIKNILIEGCNVDTAFQGVFVQGNRDITVRNCTFNNLGHNAVAIQNLTYSGAYYNKGTIVIENNTMSNGSDRAIRIGDFTDGSLTIKNNTISDFCDSADEVAKASSFGDSAVVSLDGNTYNGVSLATTFNNNVLMKPAT